MYFDKMNQFASVRTAEARYFRMISLRKTKSNVRRSLNIYYSLRKTILAAYNLMRETFICDLQLAGNTYLKPSLCLELKICHNLKTPKIMIRIVMKIKYPTQPSSASLATKLKSSKFFSQKNNNIA